ncbi:MAG TPA: SusC/RagA family TonB-linked outer membrane protein, partial [Flavisolibacter sp.]|nr:SusC/RagA family TonB-linked outer membrane protein [Flavisolibacter sp.]
MRRLKLLLLTGLLFCVQVLWAQVQVTGKVTDQKDGSPLPGVTVTIKNTNRSTITNAEGTYSISAPDNGTLVFSFVGFGTVERPVGNSVNVALAAGDNAMTEVVVTGYTTQTRRSAPGSIARVKADEVRLQPVASFEQALQGKSPGVLIQSASGQPGSPASVTIRGKGSVLGSTQPLYIVDGIQISAADFQSLNPSDFESYNILKDAVATSQYGSRGANGVIVITTKKGTANKTRLTYDYQYGIGELPENKLRLMNSAEKIAFELSADGIYGTNPNGWSDAEADSLSKVNGNWAGAMFRKANTQQHQISLTGGNERTRFFASGSVFDQEGVVISTGLKRATGRLNLDHTAGDFRLGLSAFVGSSKFTNTSEANTGIGSPLNAIRWHLPYVTPYLADGSYNQADNAIQGQPNALQELLENPRTNRQLKGIAAMNLEYRAPFLQGLTAKTNLGIDFTDNSNQRYINPTTYLGSQQIGAQGAFSQGNNRNRRFTVTNSIGYRGQSGDHGYSINLFNELIQNRFTSFGYTGFGLAGAFRNAAGITPGTASNGFIPVVNGNETNSALLSYFAIGDYNFRNKYFLNGTVRRDGASKLAEGNKWTTFGGIGASWVISAEDFMKNSAFSDLKLKVSYGSSANSNVGGDFEALEQFGATSYNGVGGLVLVNIKKPNLTWETRSTFNAGVDFGLLKNRVTGTVEVYNSVTNGLYLNRQISGTSGTTAILTNLGRMRNRGLEASITANIFRGQGFNWSLTANHTYNQNRILELDGGPENI